MVVLKKEMRKWRAMHKNLEDAVHEASVSLQQSSFSRHNEMCAGQQEEPRSAGIRYVDGHTDRRAGEQVSGWAFGGVHKRAWMGSRVGGGVPDY